MTDDESDAMLDRLDRGEPAASKEEAEAREPYERLISRIRDLPNENPPDGWESRLEQRRHRASGGARRRRRWLAPAAVAGVAAAAMAVFVMRCLPKSVTDDAGGGSAVIADLSVEMKPRKPDKRSDEATVGDTVVASGKMQSGKVTGVRLYRGEALVASCPGHSSCVVNGEFLELSVEIETAGYYRAMLIHGEHEPPSTSRGFELDRADLFDAGFAVRVESFGTVKP